MARDRDQIQEQMLENVPDKYQKALGSFFYDALKPVAISLEELDIKAEENLNKGFVATAEGSDLDRKCFDLGIFRDKATKSKGLVIITGVPGAAIPKGEAVASDNVRFLFVNNGVLPEPGVLGVAVECETPGRIGNVPVGAIKYFPKTLEGLQTVTNANAFSGGYEEESDESLREKYFLKVRNPATSGNKWHYANWAREVPGVGDARVFPLADGPGSVTVLILDADKVGAPSNLVLDVKAHIEENRPIGASVTVESAAEKEVAITVASFAIDENNFTLDQVLTAIEKNIKQYLKSIAFKETYVSYGRVGSVILDSEGVIDYTGLKLNGAMANIEVLETEVAVLGGVDVE